MKIDAQDMKILKIENNKGYFRTSEDEDWSEIDTIGKENLMALLDVFISTDVEMDEPDSENLQNQVQLIIYRSVFEKFRDLGENKSTFKDESNKKYLSAVRKYSDGLEPEESPA